MRTEKEMLDTILTFAENDERIRIVGMEGSRTNPNAPTDKFQDYDITYIVTEKEPFINDEEWLKIFGKRIFTQKPEAMKLFYPQLGNWFSYLMLFEDGIRIDLTIVPIEELDLYLTSDSLLKILLDKDDHININMKPSEELYKIQKPTVTEFDDCCNEFWWISTYVAKGIWREEFIYAAGYIHRIIRRELLRMISWKIGFENNFSVNVGQHYKYLENYVSPEVWDRILGTYRFENYEQLWDSLFECQKLFREVSTEVAEVLNYPYPEYDQKITAYIQEIYEEYVTTSTK